jgi:serine/threonine-protein kinase
MSEPEPARLELNRLQYGSYRVLHPLGSGGMSSVYRAVHVDSGLEVALKVLPTGRARNAIVLQRFLREARSAESLEHPHIVSIYDRGVDHGRHYLVLEYVEGCDLHDYVQLYGPRPAAEAVRIVRDVAEGLRFAQTRGLIHRDIKPSNILRSTAGEIKITDLGLALQAQFEDERVTREGTTVGTVDYMAPEQARDSRATSHLSDQYSLGCTLYYLLTGLPPYPGGDITDKLTKHARSPVPNVLDVRRDIPEGLARIVLRMMEKAPESRFPSFEDLIDALDRVPVEAPSESSSVSLVPLEDVGLPLGPPAAPREVITPRAGDSLLRPPSSIPEISLASLPAALFEEGGEGGSAPSLAAGPHRGVLPRRGAGVPALPGLLPAPPNAAPLSLRSWIGLSVLIGVSFLLLVVLIDQLVRTRSSSTGRDAADLEIVEPSPPIGAPPATPEITRASMPQPVVAPGPADVRPPAVPGAKPPESHRVSRSREPGPSGTEQGGEPYRQETLRQYLPAWALRSIPDRVEGPLVQVRRFSVPGDSQAPTLRMGLDETKGTVEIADDGPLLINDFRITGETRLVRASPGFRPVIRIERPTLPAVREQPGVIALREKSLILDSLDLVLNVRDLPPGQTALFFCQGADLTVRNCTITLLNPGGQPFSLVRAEGTGTRESRVRFEKVFVRGPFRRGFEVGGGTVKIALRDSCLMASQGPVLLCDQSAPDARCRFSTVGSYLVGRGPAVELKNAGAGGTRPRPLELRSFDTVFGRLPAEGPIVASLIWADDDAAPRPQDRIEWRGDRNLFVGWSGFYACGPGPTIRVPGLLALRSTWNGSDGESQEIPVRWPPFPHPEYCLPGNLKPFVAQWDAALARVPVPRPYLIEKTLGEFPHPDVPSLGGPARGNPPWGDQPELVFDAGAERWHGDLGIFLHENVVAGMRHARVRAVGAGAHRFTPVRLPDGIVLELRVEPSSSSNAPGLSWSPAEDATGRALIELHGGTLFLSELRLVADAKASLESLVRAEDANLVLRRCHLLAPSGSEARTPRLISFVSKASKGRGQVVASDGVLARDPDRPFCLLDQCTVITEGAALQAEVGRGLVAIEHSAISAGTDALQLDPVSIPADAFEADLVLEHCTISSEANIVRLGPLPGDLPGPDRPWLVSSSNTVFLASYDRITETVLLRADEVAMAAGVLFWQENNDIIQTDSLVAAGESPPSSRSGDVVLYWTNVWGNNHIRGVLGTRLRSSQPYVRLYAPLRTGKVRPSDLLLDPSYHPGRPGLDVGANFSPQDLDAR